MNEQQIEQEIQAKGLTAPRVTPDRINEVIVGQYYFTARQGVNANGTGDEVSAKDHKALSLLTFCVLILRNGFTVTGESACVSPENFDAEIGKKIAFENAKQKIWALEGYALRNALSS